MKLEDIGFYTLSDNRAKNCSINSSLQRCELIVTNRCNFNCPYCRGTPYKELSVKKALKIINLWVKDGLKNIRFSGGEPTLYPYLDFLVKVCKAHGVKHIAVSTNGSATLKYYKYLIACGVNDFSISLDGGCCSIGDKMTGGIRGAWKIVTKNIKALSKLTYVTVGIVFNEENINDAYKTVIYADSIGVADIRIIPSAQYNQALMLLSDLPDKILNKHPILKYRVNNLQKGKNVRGLETSLKCWLAIDDMVVAGDYHFPCVIYMRERGLPINKVGKHIRQERYEWIQRHNPLKDPICSKMCLDVCVDYNKKVKMYKKLLTN